jgi:GNAT superfamily N-acetyltransferase
VEAIGEKYGRGFRPYDRYSFSSEGLSRERLYRICQASPVNGQVREMSVETIAGLRGPEHFIDLADFDSAEDFCGRSAGFTLGPGGEIIGAAWGSLACSRGIEASVYVRPEHRRRGIATLLAARLLMWCLDKRMEAHWDAANPESCKLALKLGYRATGSYEAYGLDG